MKTFIELYRELLTDERWQHDIEPAITHIFDEINIDHSDENRELFELEKLKVTTQLRQTEFPRNEKFIIVGYVMTDYDGFSYYCVPMFFVDDILKMESIRPWDKLFLQIESAYENGNIYFDEMDDNAIVAALSCMHLLPVAHPWRDCTADNAFGCLVYPGIPPVDFVKEVILHHIFAELDGNDFRGMPIDCIDREVIPMPCLKEDEYDFLEDNAKDRDSIELRRYILLSCLDLYRSLNKAKTALLLEVGRDGLD